MESIHANLNMSTHIGIHDMSVEPIDTGILIEEIVKQGDRQNRRTNLHADMTQWNMTYVHPEFTKLADIVLSKCVIPHLLASRYNMTDVMDSDFVLQDLWGGVYKGDGIDEAIPHDHLWSTVSFVYYLQTPTGSAPLVFPECDVEIQAEEGKLVTFSGLIQHAVPPRVHDGQRIMLAGNWQHLPPQKAMTDYLKRKGYKINES